jgi:hypothetical protein
LAEYLYKVSYLDFSDHLFWDVDKTQLDIDLSAAFVIERVLEYGLMKDWNLLKSYYGLDKIKEVSLNIRCLDPVTLSFVSFLFEIPETEFRCYKYTRSAQNFWT